MMLGSFVALDLSAEGKGLPSAKQGTALSCNCFAWWESLNRISMFFKGARAEGGELSLNKF